MKKAIIIFLITICLLFVGLLVIKEIKQNSIKRVIDSSTLYNEERIIDAMKMIEQYVGEKAEYKNCFIKTIKYDEDYNIKCQKSEKALVIQTDIVEGIVFERNERIDLEWKMIYNSIGESWIILDIGY